MMMLKRRLSALIIFLSVMAVQAEPISGYAFLSETSKEMQDDEFANPGMETVELGERLYHAEDDYGRSCVECHGENGHDFNRKRLTRFPVYDEIFKKPLTLQAQINRCWEERLDNFPYLYDSKELVALETYVRYLVRGEPVNVVLDTKLKYFYDLGEKLYNTRFGQLDMACVMCHEYFQGQWLRGEHLSQGQSNGFPVYRLGSERITSLHRRMKECFASFRAEPFEPGSDEFINLELYLHARGNGLPIETPAVRN